MPDDLWQLAILAVVCVAFVALWWTVKGRG